MLFVPKPKDAPPDPVRSVEHSFDWLWLEIAAGKNRDLIGYLRVAEDTLKYVRPTRRA